MGVLVPEKNTDSLKKQLCVYTACNEDWSRFLEKNEVLVWWYLNFAN